MMDFHNVSFICVSFSWKFHLSELVRFLHRTLQFNLSKSFFFFSLETILLHFCFLLLSLSLLSPCKYCFRIKFPKWRFWCIYTLWGPLNPKIIFLVGWSGVCVCVCVISITQKQITKESSNLAFYICILYRYCLKFFIKIG